MSPPRRTYETPPENGVEVPPPRPRSGTGADPEEDGFVAPRTRGDSTDGDRTRNNESGAEASGAFDTQKPILGTETVIPQRPAEAAPVKEEGNSGDVEKITIPDKSASKPVIEKRRMALRASFAAPQSRTRSCPARSGVVGSADQCPHRAALSNGTSSPASRKMLGCFQSSRGGRLSRAMAAQPETAIAATSPSSNAAP